jgi:hypothetical protein
MKKTLQLVGVCGAALFVLACETKIDNGKLEGAIREDLKKRGLELTELKCPTDLTAKAGGTFECTGKDDKGTSATFDITMKDDKGDVNWKLKGSYIDMTKVGALLTDAIGKQLEGKKVEVKCPTKTMFEKPGSKFTCDATVDGAAKKVAVTTDEKNGVDFKME